MKFKNKKVIITGASKGIGQNLAFSFAKEGAELVMSYCSNKKSAIETVDIINSCGGKSRAFQADFSDVKSVKTFVQKALNQLGNIDIVINNAAMLARENIFELSLDKMQKVFQVNTISPLYLSQLCLENMIKEQNKGCIINISSIAATVTAQHGIGYAASKAAMNKWTKNAALNLAEYGIRVNAIAPGVIKSGMNETTENSNPKLWQYYLSNIPLKRAGMPVDISNMALFLASDEASWITGKIFEVDGGHVL
ncbi:glucose 1-dehydrogenase [Thiotrichales bacterium 19S3-7]|nr:glucose 1-dehydrogenase [Thiotrichales bacterium 19S3-7]MCF6802619.1 glucose 1-dehydrogenase [Thiotrichales bacterium 19S3-11]